jgi:hypothetical protein
MVTDDAALKRELLRAMLLIRRFEEKILEVLAYGRLASTMCHVSIGQEAVAAGVCAALVPGDYSIHDFAPVLDLLRDKRSQDLAMLALDFRLFTADSAESLAVASRAAADAGPHGKIVLRWP